LINYPVLATKAFYQNVSLKLAISNIKDVDLKIYGINKIPSLIVFENAKPIKVIY
jgi:hypothetical protein